MEINYRVCDILLTQLQAIKDGWGICQNTEFLQSSYALDVLDLPNVKELQVDCQSVDRLG